MNFSLPYGKEQWDFSLREDFMVSTLEANASQPLANLNQAVREALDTPIGAPPLGQIIKPGEKVVIVTSDITRLSFRTDAYLPIILDTLNSAGVPDTDITIVMATGTHRLQTEKEHRLIIGEEAYRRVQVVDHIADSADLVPLGVTSRGTEISLNRLVAEADRVIVTGGVSYHLLAGFGGGRKSIVPGVCSYRGIQQNHALALSKQRIHPMVQTGILEGNPVAEDMLEGTRLLNPDFLVNVVVNEHKEIIAVVAGELEAAFLAGCKVVADTFGVVLDELSDLVIASCGGYPKDIQLYQAIKALDNAAYAVSPGAPIILLAECSDGLGSADFINWFKFGEPADILQALAQEFTMPGFVALRTASIIAEHPVYLISQLPPEQVRELGMIPAPDLDTALAVCEAVMRQKYQDPSTGSKYKATSPRVLIMPHASLTFPILRG
jgi:lactate racemase